MRFTHPVLLMAATNLGLLIASFVVMRIPLVNFFATMLLVPFWFGLVLQLSMLALVFLALTREIGRGWLILPLVFWSACTGLSLASAQRAQNVAKSIQAANAAVTWRAPIPFEYRAIDHGSVGYSEIVERFRFTRAYFVGEKDTTVRYFAKGAECEQASKGFFYEHRFDDPFLYRPDIFRSYKGPNKTEQCVLSIDMPGQSNPPYSVENEYVGDRGDWLNPRFGERFKVIDNAIGQPVAQVETASIRVISPLIVFAVGCQHGMLTSSPKDCGIWPSYKRRPIAAGYKPRVDKGNPFIPTTDPMNSRVGALGRAIGLEPRLPTD